MTTNILKQVRAMALLKWKKGDPTISKSTEKIREERRKAAEWGAKQALLNITPEVIAAILINHEYDSTNVDRCICGEKVKAMMLEHQSQLIANTLN